MVFSVITDISTVKSMKRWRLKLMLTTKELQEKIKMLEEVDSLRNEAQGKAIALECEVAVLKEEADSLKEMLESF